MPLAVIHHVHGCHTVACDRRVSHRRHETYWTRRVARLPLAVRRELARLRQCESTNNYRAVNGSHTGAYQYDGATWHQAGGHGQAMDASPAEQDYRTGLFYPSHRGQWACSA